MPVLGDRIVECCCGGRTRVYHIADIGSPYNCSSTNSTLQRTGQLPSARHGHGVPSNSRDGSWQRVRFSDEEDVSRESEESRLDGADAPPELPEKTKKRKSGNTVLPVRPYWPRDAKRSVGGDGKEAHSGGGESSDVTVTTDGSLRTGAATCGTSITTDDVIGTSEPRVGGLPDAKSSQRHVHEPTPNGTPSVSYSDSTYRSNEHLSVGGAIYTPNSTLSREQHYQHPGVTNVVIDAYDNSATRMPTEQQQQQQQQNHQEKEQQQQQYYLDSSKNLRIQHHAEDMRMESSAPLPQLPTPAYAGSDAIIITTDGSLRRPYAGYTPPGGRDVMARFHRISQYDNSPPDVSPRSDSTMYSSRQSSERYFLSDVGTPQMMTSHSEGSPAHSPASLLTDTGGSAYRRDNATRDRSDGCRLVASHDDAYSSSYTWQDIVDYYDEVVIAAEQRMTSDRGSPTRPTPTPDSEVYIVGRVYFDGERIPNRYGFRSLAYKRVGLARGQTMLPPGGLCKYYLSSCDSCKYKLTREMSPSSRWTLTRRPCCAVIGFDWLTIDLSSTWYWLNQVNDLNFGLSSKA
ncbi:hypothetical protein LSH36_416g00004 [Paralvinella palmiformis]|uniref:Uncharacterized protein n=1 Tax=Paralvinella palmiformis TaxID=53620 RepID=A0AAD9JBP0_9ANNE|nr:hypothetical protein LSH36_416g00004 [Paralvinella palmiformis]